MQTLPYGLKVPEAGIDSGEVVFDALEGDLIQIDAHSHDGVTSKLLAPTTQNISSASWGSDLGGGSWKQTITLPGALTFDTISIQIRLSTGHIIYSTVNKLSSTTYEVYVNDNTLNLTAVYST